MGDTARDPVDHHRTTQPVAGEAMKNTAKTPGLVLVAAAAVAFVVCLASFAIRQVDVGVSAAIVALLTIPPPDTPAKTSTDPDPLGRPPATCTRQSGACAP